MQKDAGGSPASPALFIQPMLSPTPSPTPSSKDASPPAPPPQPARADADTVGLRYIMGRVRAMCRHTPDELAAIAQKLLDVRLRFHLCKHDWLQIVPPIFIGFHGFATDFERSVFLRVLRHATKPRVFYSTFLPGGAFEGFAIIHPTTSAADVQQLEALFELFKMSAGVTDLGQYMSAPMVACIERVEAGVRPFGNFRSLRAGNVRVAYMHAKQRRDNNVQLERVRTETGLAFSTINMLQVHYQLTNTQIELGQAFALLYRLRLLIGAMPLALDAPTSAVTHVIVGPMSLFDPSASVQMQYIANLRALIDNFVGSVHSGDAAPRLAVEVVDLTM